MHEQGRCVRIVIAAISAALVLVAVGPQRAWADPLLITSGVYSVHSGDPTFFLLTGDGYQILADATNITPGPVATCAPSCLAGTAIDLATQASGNIGQLVDRPDFPTQFNGVSYSTVYYTGSLAFNAPFVEAPPVTDRAVVFNEPFTFTGQLTGYATAERNTPPLFTTALSGGGDVRFSIFASPTPNRYEYGDLDYVFSPTGGGASPTPEPSTLLLVASAIGFAGRRVLIG